MCLFGAANIRTITVFGATGQIGRRVMDRALDKGLRVRAFTRTAAKFIGPEPNLIDVYEGCVLEEEDVDKAVQGVDAVVIALGNGGSIAETTTLSDGTANIVKAMEKYNITTVSVCLSMFLYSQQEAAPPLIYNECEDHKRMYDILINSSLNFIAVLPPYFTNLNPCGDVIITINGNKSPGLCISMKSLGDFLVDCLIEPQYFRKRIGISNP